MLPRQIIRQMKKGEVPQPETFESVSVFLCDIVGFTTLSSESTAHQIVDMLNLLYNMYDSRIDAYDVYKVCLKQPVFNPQKLKKNTFCYPDWGLPIPISM